MQVLPGGPFLFYESMSDTNSIIACFLAANKSDKNKQAGAVQWCETPPPGISYQTHKFTFIDAVEQAKTYVWGMHKSDNTPMKDTWMKVGPKAHIIVTTLPQSILGNYQEIPTDRLTYIAHLGNTAVFLDPAMKNDEFQVGDKDFVVAGQIVPALGSPAGKQ